jgi:hypothetical protein
MGRYEYAKAPKAKRKSDQKPSNAMLPYLVYLNHELVVAIDEWRRQQEGEPSRSDAIRRMAWRVIRANQDPGHADLHAVK